MKKITETPDEIKCRVIEKCQRGAAIARERGDFYLATVREAQANTLNETLQPHPFLGGRP